MTTTKAGCIFCGGRPVTREHVIPSWLGNVLRQGADHFVHRFDHKGTTQWKNPELDFTIKAVCGPCNYGWMSDLEQCVKPILTPLVLGDRRWILPPAQFTLAHWAAKTAVVVCARDRSARPLPAGVADAIRAGSIPGGVFVSAYAYGPTEKAAWFTSRDMAMQSEYTVTEPVDVKAVTFSVGHFVAQVGIFPNSPDIDLMVDARLRDHRLELWPSRTTTADWPPPAALSTDADLLHVAEGYIAKGPLPHWAKAI